MLLIPRLLSVLRQWFCCCQFASSLFSKAQTTVRVCEGVGVSWFIFCNVVLSIDCSFANISLAMRELVALH